MATRRTPDPILLAEEHGSSPRLEIAPLTVSANPKQPITLGWKWRNDWWEDEATGWRGLWAFDGDGTIMNRIRAVRVRIVEDWPLLSATGFYGVLCGATHGHRPATLADEAAFTDELAVAPIAPVEDVRQTLTAQITALVSGQ